jgi:hypothetical protein
MPRGAGKVKLLSVLASAWNVFAGLDSQARRRKFGPALAGHGLGR